MDLETELESFRLRVTSTKKKGLRWEFFLVPVSPRRGRKLPDRLLGSQSAPAAIRWLREIVRPITFRMSSGIDINQFGPGSAPLTLPRLDGMRLALAFSAARYLASPTAKKRFREGLEELPKEVLLYWFTLCFFGERTAAGRAALRTLLTYRGR